MIPWQELGRASVPGGRDELSLHRRGEELSIRIGRAELMNSRQHGSEEALARLGCAAIRARRRARVLVGGLGMGFTLRAALDQLAPDAEVAAVELIGAVIAWNREHLGHLAGHPLRDPRVRVHEADVAAVMAARAAAFDAILLDVDNGPSGLTRERNTRLYGARGLSVARAALREGGALAVWSVARDDAFSRRLADAGFEVAVHGAGARGEKGARHTVWVATKP